jgi:hypothetical protein
LAPSDLKPDPNHQSVELLPLERWNTMIRDMMVRSRHFTIRRQITDDMSPVFVIQAQNLKVRGTHGKELIL